MIYIDLDKNYLMVNNKIMDMNKLAYLNDSALLESMSTEFKDFMVNEAVAWDTVKALAKKGFDFATWGIPKVLSYLKSFLPDTLEGWIHLGVDVISLILDILGPFTAGAGNVASAVIDVLHGIYYIGASQGDAWPMFPDRSDKELEYLLCGFITIGFAAVPIAGNAETIGFTTFLKKNPIGKNVVEWLDKLLASGVGKAVKKVFEWLFKTIGSLGRWFFDKFTSLSKIPIIGKIFGWFGDVLKSGLAKVANGLDALLLKLFKNPGMMKWAEKNFGKEAVEGITKHQTAVQGAKTLSKNAAKVGKETGERVAKTGAEKGVVKDVTKQATKLTKAGVKDFFRNSNAYLAFSSKLKMYMAQIFAEKISITQGLNMAWSLLASTKIGEKASELTSFKKAEVINQKDIDQYKDWYLKYAFFLDDADVDDDDLSNSDIVKIQTYLITNAELYNGKDLPKETGELDSKTIYCTRQLFEFLKDQDISELSGEELENSKELVEHCKEGLDKLNDIDKSFFKKIEEHLPSIKKNELMSFENFTKENYLK